MQSKKKHKLNVSPKLAIYSKTNKKPMNIKIGA